MRFAFTDDQLALRDATGAVLTDLCSPAALRTVIDPGSDARAQSAARWDALCELGIPATTLPEAAGGLGLGDVELILIAEAAGRVALPEPLTTTAQVAIPLLVRTGHADAAADLIGRHARISVGGVAFGAERHRCTTAVGAHATTALVSHHQSDAFILVGPQDGGFGVYLVTTDALVERTGTPSLDGLRDIGVLTWQPTAALSLATGDGATALVCELVNRQALTAAAELCGLAETMITITADYVRERKQFGVAVGSFQAVKHHLANARVRLEFARPAVYRAAWSMAIGADTVDHDVSMAKSLASDAADLAGSVALQCHGAIGYTWESDLQLYLKHAWSLSAACGDATSHRARVLDEVVKARSTELQ